MNVCFPKQTKKKINKNIEIFWGFGIDRTQSPLNGGTFRFSSFDCSLTQLVHFILGRGGVVGGYSTLRESTYPTISSGIF
jgi:hypothetical protein